MSIKKYEIKKGKYYIGDISNFIKSDINFNWDQLWDNFWTREPNDIIVEINIDKYNFIMFMEIDGNNEYDFASDTSTYAIINEDDLNNEIFNDGTKLSGVHKFEVKKDGILYKADNELYYKDGIFKKYLVKK